jgi:hypothetical protein
MKQLQRRHQPWVPKTAADEALERELAELGDVLKELTRRQLDRVKRAASSVVESSPGLLRDQFVRIGGLARKALQGVPQLKALRGPLDSSQRVFAAPPAVSPGGSSATLGSSNSGSGGGGGSDGALLWQAAAQTDAVAEQFTDAPQAEQQREQVAPGVDPEEEEEEGDNRKADAIDLEALAARGSKVLWTARSALRGAVEPTQRDRDMYGRSIRKDANTRPGFTFDGSDSRSYRR